MNESEYKNYKKAGDVLRKALKYALDNVEEDSPLIEIASKIENIIRSYNAMPAFPVNISQNYVAAHYSPGIKDDSVIKKKAIVKIDIGVHIDGYIADAAITISFDDSYEKLVKAAKEALKNVQEILKPGLSLGSIGKAVKSVADLYGVKPIANLTGHKIERYELHAGKSVPNVPSWNFSKVKEGEVYAVEPFMTNGEGLVIEGGNGHIYRVKSMRRLKDKELMNSLILIWEKYKSLPFSERWLKGTFKDPLSVLKKLIAVSRIHNYLMLIERKKGNVSQYEDTFIVHNDGAEPLARVLEL